MSPYLKPYRLQDIIGVLQIMGSAKNYKRSAEGWSKIIENKPLSATSWEEIFREHPEFFRESGKNRFCIMWRKGLPQDKASGEHEPLSADQITALMDTALQFHAKAQDKRREKRWWIPIFAAIMAFAGAILGSYLKWLP